MSAPMGHAAPGGGLGRRGLGARVAAAALTPGIGNTPAGRDAALLEACGQFNALEERYIAALESGDCQDEAECDRMAATIREAQEPWIGQVLTLRAVTPEGMRARLRAVLLADELMHPARLLASGYVGQALLGALLRDLGAWLDAGARTEGAVR